MTIKVSTGVVESSAAVLNTCNNEINSAIENIQQSINSLEWGWQGRSGYHARESYNELKNDRNNNRNNSMLGYVNFLNKAVAPGYDETESSNSTLAGLYKG